MGTPVTSVKILNGTALSANIPLGNLVLDGIAIPTLTSCDLTFQVSSDGGTTFQDFWVPGTGGTPAIFKIATTTGNLYLSLDPNLFIGVDTMLIKSSVNQGADRVFNLHVRYKS